MKKALVILNPSSGNENAKEYEELITKTLKKVYDEVDIKETKKFGDATKFALVACEDQVDLLVSMGGDGTVNEVINGLAAHETRPPYGIIPLGTVNDLAQALSIPQNVGEAIKMLINGQTKTIDIGRINENYFGNMVTVGKVPEAIHDVSIEEKTRLGALAYYVEGAKRILENETFHARISFNDYVWEGEIAALIIGLTRALGAFNRIFPDAEVDDGVLHVIAIKDLSLFETLKLTPDFLAGTLEKSDNVTYRALQKIKIEILDSEEMTSGMDGDEGPKLPIEVEVMPEFLDVIVPKE